MTQAQFAEFAGVPHGAIVGIENRRHGATLTTLYSIAKALGMEVGDLLPSVSEVQRLERTGTEDLVDAELPEWSSVIDAHVDLGR